MKSLIQNKLGSSEVFELERCHRVGNGNPKLFIKQQRNDGRDMNNEPRPPIVAKYLKWKEKETVFGLARSRKPDGIKFVQEPSPEEERKFISSLKPVHRVK